MSSDRYGIEYSPSNVSSGPNLTVAQLQERGIRYIRIHWVDLVNHVRCRILPTSYFMKLLDSNRPGTSIAKAALGIVFLTLAPGFTPTGEYLYALDLPSLRLCSYAPGHASVMGWFQEKLPIMSSTGPTVGVGLCPRTTLHRVVEEAKSVSSIEFLVGFETEFILLKSTSPIEATNTYDWSIAAAFSSGSVEAKVLEEIADGIQIAGIELQMYHKEAAPGQYEVVTGPMAPLQAADALVLTREIIFNIANKHGLRATFAPRLDMTSCGSAAHAHISVHSSPARPTSSGLAPHESSFLSSVLSHITAIAALTMPIKPSYARMQDGVWSGGTYVCWGTENRETLVRLCNANNPSSRNFEFRCLDGTANPYLALAAILGAGHAGIREKAVLRILDCAGGTGAAQMGEDERRALGITERMPLAWEDARKNLREDKLLSEVLGSDMVATFLGVHETLASGVDSRCQNENEAATLLVQMF